MYNGLTFKHYEMTSCIIRSGVRSRSDRTILSAVIWFYKPSKKIHFWWYSKYKKNTNCLNRTIYWTINIVNIPEEWLLGAGRLFSTNQELATLKTVARHHPAICTSLKYKYNLYNVQRFIAGSHLNIINRHCYIWSSVLSRSDRIILSAVI